MFYLRKTILAFLFLLLLSQFVFGWIGNIHYQGQDPMDFTEYWDQVTPENGGKWASCEQSRDDWGYWSWLDAAYDFANNNNFPFKEHCLIWGHSSGEPSWVCGLSQAEQLEEVEEWIQIFGQRYSGVDFIDVVNEPLHDPPCYKDAIGGDGVTGWDWVVWSFEKANQYISGTRILNDYGLLNNSSNAGQIANIRDICGAQAVGAEAHGIEYTSAGTISSNFDIIGGTVYVSELDIDIRDDNQQLQIYQDIFPTLHSESAGVTLWGYIEGEIWKTNAYLLKTDGTRRPALNWLCNNYLPCTGTTTTTTACVPDGGNCDVDSDCCSGDCSVGKPGTRVCLPGGTTTSTTTTSGTTTTSSTTTTTTSDCIPRGEPCTSNDECCSTKCGKNGVCLGGI